MKGMCTNGEVLDQIMNYFFFEKQPSNLFLEPFSGLTFTVFSFDHRYFLKTWSKLCLISETFGERSRGLCGLDQIHDISQNQGWML